MARKNKEDEREYQRKYRKKKGKMYFRRYLREYRKRKKERKEETEVIIWWNKLTADKETRKSLRTSRDFFALKNIRWQQKYSVL